MVCAQFSILNVVCKTRPITFLAEKQIVPLVISNDLAVYKLEREKYVSDSCWGLPTALSSFFVYVLHKFSRTGLWS